MKRILLLMLGLCLGCMACNNTPKDSVVEDDSTVMPADTAKHAEIVMDSADVRFITDVASACLSEIELGNLAKQRGKDKRVKNLGMMTVRDVTKAQVKLIALAKEKKIILPDSISTAAKNEIAGLAKKTGKDFDFAYLAKTRADHKNAVDMFQAEANHAYDADIKGFAARHMLPLKRHIDAIDAIHDSMQ